MELTNMIREGDLVGIGKWLDENPQPSRDDITSGGVSIAHWAASSEHTDILRLIIDKLPQLIDQQNSEDGATPLHWAAQDNREKNIEHLISKGAQVHLTDYMGETPLHLAAMNGFLGCVQLLCAAAPSSAEFVNLQSSEGNTALHLATLNSNKRIVAYLLSMGADPDLQNKKKESPRSIASSKKDKQLLDYYDPEKLKLLEEIEKARDENEDLQVEIVNMKNVVEAEIRKREQAYTAIKLGEDKIYLLEEKCRGLEEELNNRKVIIDSKDEEIKKLEARIQELSSKHEQLENDYKDVSNYKAPLTARDFPSEVVYSKVLVAQAELQKLHKVLEQSEAAILTAKTSINQLEESLGR